jgi:glycine cleavage system H protein
MRVVKPEELLYSESHEWVQVAPSDSTGGGKIATIGISAFAVEQLTDLVFMQLPGVGKVVAAGTEFGEVESVKAVSSLYSPVSGEVVAVNSQLPTNLDILKTDPYGQGWMVKVRMSHEGELAKLLDHAAYQKQCADHG